MPQKKHKPEEIVAKLRQGCCQTDANSSRIRQVRWISVRAEAAPLGESGGAGLLVGWAAREASFGVEEVVD